MISLARCKQQNPFLMRLLSLCAFFPGPRRAQEEERIKKDEWELKGGTKREMYFHKIIVAESF